MANGMTTRLDTSEKSKENSKQAIESLGGDDNLYGKKDQPRSKNAAENLTGSRVDGVL